MGGWILQGANEGGGEVRVYRIKFYEQLDGSRGYAFASSKAEAAKIAREFTSGGTDDNPHSAEVEAIEFQPTLTSFLRVLNSYAVHPDNG
jgi:hypothetical protein